MQNLTPLDASNYSFLDDIRNSHNLSSFVDLITRMNIWDKILFRLEQEKILKLVPIESEWLESRLNDYLQGRDLEDVLS